MDLLHVPLSLRVSRQELKTQSESVDPNSYFLFKTTQISSTLFIRKDKNLSGQRELTKSSIQSIWTEKGSNETSAGLTVSSIGCLCSVRLVNMRNATL